MSNDDRRLIEDYLPIEAISKEASREKSVRKGHISTLHLWWARRPLVACRAAVYGALVPASRFRPHNGPEEKRDSLARANAARFIERLCKYPGDPQVIAEAQQHILEAHAERLTQESGKKVTVKDIEEGRAPRPKVLDMFAGGGAIPLEALRLGCEAYALDLNPVAHIIELCTLVYPQKYGKPDPTARGMAGPKDSQGETTWGGLAQEVRYWGNWVLDKVKAEIGDLYPPIPDPKAPKTRQVLGKAQLEMTGKGFEHPGQQKLAVETPAGYLTPVAYLWTRNVQCRKPSCRASVPLVRQTWLCKKKDRYVALKMIAPKGKKQVCFEVVEARTEKGLGFDPEAFSKAGNAACPFCGTVADSTYVKAEGCAGRLTIQLMAAIATSAGRNDKSYIGADSSTRLVPAATELANRLNECTASAGFAPPDERIETNPRSMDSDSYGLNFWRDLFLPRQMICLINLTKAAPAARAQMDAIGIASELADTVQTYLGLLASKMAQRNNTMCAWDLTSAGGRLGGAFARQAVPMVWDFAEANPIGGASGDIGWALDTLSRVLDENGDTNLPARVVRGTATALPLEGESVDAVITDPPYYDSVTYSNLSDFFYVWLKRSIGDLYPEDFAGNLTPKRNEAIAAFYRHQGSREKARTFYEATMVRALQEAHRVLRSEAPLIMIYAHKTTAGWATLVDGLRSADFEIYEAWPLETELKGGLRLSKAMLASSIFLVARKRDNTATGNYEKEVQPELEQIVRERVGTLWEMGISGADLVIACVGAGLRAFTRFARVEYANGEEVPADRFLTEVETVVLDTILARLSKEVGGNGGRYSLAGLDPATRFYVLWRYTYKAADLDAGEAIIFANGTHVELDGLHGLSCGSRPLVEKKKSKYRLLDYTERGDDAKLGLPSEDGQSPPLVDALHRLLWLIERHPFGIPEFLREARPNTEQMRLVAQALAGPALKGGEMGEVATGSELAALTKLTANWRSVVGEEGPLFRGPRGRE